MTLRWHPIHEGMQTTMVSTNSSASEDSTIGHEDPGVSGPRDVSALLSELARSIHEKPSEIILQTVIDEAVQIIPGTDFASLSLVTRGADIESLAPSAQIPFDLDFLQASLGQGPCLEAIYSESTIRVPDMASETRWPEFSRRALGAGIRSMLALQLFVEGDNLGALNLYSQQTGAFTQESENIGFSMSAHAALALAATQTRGNLHEAVVSRDVIGQAKGILMERHKLSEHEAFLLLIAASTHTNQKLITIADDLVRTGELAKFPPRT